MSDRLFYSFNTKFHSKFLSPYKIKKDTAQQNCDTLLNIAAPDSLIYKRVNVFEFCPGVLSISEWSDQPSFPHKRESSDLLCETGFPLVWEWRR